MAELHAERTDFFRWVSFFLSSNGVHDCSFVSAVRAFRSRRGPFSFEVRAGPRRLRSFEFEVHEIRANVKGWPAPSRHALRPSPLRSFIRKVENYSEGLAHPGGVRIHTKRWEGARRIPRSEVEWRGAPIQVCPWRASCEQCPSGSRGLADRVPSTRRRSSSASFAKRSHAQSRAASSQLAATTLASSRCGCTFFHWTATVATEPCGAAPPFPLPSLAPADAVA